MIKLYQNSKETNYHTAFSINNVSVLKWLNIEHFKRDIWINFTNKIKSCLMNIDYPLYNCYTFYCFCYCLLMLNRMQKYLKLSFAILPPIKTYMLVAEEIIPY